MESSQSFQRIPRNVVILGLVSFLNDVASEMIYPLIPIFITEVLGAPVAILGLIEGIAEATASFMKFIFGYISDKAEKRKIFVLSGYILGTLSKFLIAFATMWPLVLFARVIDRLGKGVRTGARDALLLQNTTATNRGFIFGFHRSMDSAGAVLGPLIALLLLQLVSQNLREVFLFAGIPSLIGVLLLWVFIKEKKQKQTLESKPSVIKLGWKNINAKFKLFLLITILFSLGNSSDAFLLLRAKNLGFSIVLVTLVYVTYNLSQTLFSTPAGSLADRIGARKVFAMGLLIFSLVYFVFGILKNPLYLWVLFPIYGVYISFTDGVSKAYISEFIVERESGTYFGLYQTCISVATFFASFVGGILWSRFAPSYTFFYGSIMAFLAFLLLFYGKLIKKL